MDARAWGRPRPGRGLLFGLVLALGAPAAHAFEAFDGQLQVHGFGELQIRSIANDYDFSDDLDLTQLYTVLNIEVELDLLPDGYGPVDYLSLFARIEARFDCIWFRCGLFNSLDTFGNRAEHLPKRLAGARNNGFDGAQFTGDVRPRHGVAVEREDIERLDFSFKNVEVGDQRRPTNIWDVPGISTLFGVPGGDAIVGTDDDPAFYTFARFVEPDREYRWATRRVRGSVDGGDNQFLGPWEPRNEIIPLGALADRANPFNPKDINPTNGLGGSTARPYRPSPLFRAAETSFDPGAARGLYMPNAVVAQLAREDGFDDFDQNFRQSTLAWNRGASQQDEKELKELYLDIEAIEGRLWVRLGRQSIVWGKTELFRTTDQFNPQDLALSSLPTFEASRIALWAGRAVYTLGSFGPIEDLRFEVAANFDQFEPTDLGRCGEPYSPLPVCNKTIGLFAHGVAGFGLAGEVRPANPWNSWEGLEGGVRVEWRTGPFSFALVDFYGFEDIPYIETEFLFERNVDPRTGRPRRLNSRAGCDPEGLFDGDTRACLDGGRDALENHSANQQRFAVICSSSVGFSDLDRSVCAQSVFNSSREVADFVGTPIAPTDAFGGIFAGQLAGDLVLGGLVGLPLFAAIPNPFGGSVLAPLNVDPLDGGPPSGDIFCTDPAVRILFGIPGGGDGATCLQEFLTDAQEALLGCGPFFGVSCDVAGIDLLNAEMSALIQSWPGFPGTFGTPWDTFDAGLAQPGTVGFDGGALCTRVERGRTFVLPGCRGPGDEGYDPDIDGSPTGILHPFTGQPFKNELAALSWNYLVSLVAPSRASGSRRPRRPSTSSRPATPSARAPARSASPSSAPTSRRSTRWRTPRSAPCVPAATAASAAPTSTGTSAARGFSATRSATCSASRWTWPRTGPRPTGASRPPGSRTSCGTTTCRRTGSRPSTSTTSRSRWTAPPSSTS